MQKIILIMTLGLTVCFAQAQRLTQNETPAAVKEAFAKHYPDADNVTWSKERADEFEAEFTSNGAKQSVNFDEAGNWLETETEINKSELPSNVIATIEKELPDYKIEEAKQIETPSEGIFYEVGVEKGELKYDAQFSMDGRVLRVKEKEKEKEKRD